jgi:hypothetical protein
MHLSIWCRPFVDMVGADQTSAKKGTTNMPQYLVSVWHDDTYGVDFSTSEAQRRVAQVDAFNDELQKAGAWVFAAGLHPASSATVVRSSGGDVSMTDGPYAETKEQMGGFWMIEVPDLDTALKWAGKAAAACEGPVEVRPAQG